MSQSPCFVPRLIGVLTGLTLGVAPPLASAQDAIPAGTPIAVRVAEAIDSRRADPGREYSAELDEPLVVNGVTVAPKSAPAFLRVTEVQRAGAVRGRAALTLRLEAIVVNGQRVPIGTDTVTASSGSQAAKATKGGVLGGLAGAALGGVVGGTGGAAKGAAIGASGGVGVAALSGQRVQVAKETRLTFTVSEVRSLVAEASPQPAPAAPAPAPQADRPQPSTTTATLDQVQFDFVDAVADGKTLEVTLSVLNRGVDKLTYTRSYCTPVQVIDDAGNSYEATTAMLGNQSAVNRSVAIISGVKAVLTLRFEGLQTVANVPVINEIKRLSMAVSIDNTRPTCRTVGRIELRNLRVQKR